MKILAIGDTVGAPGREAIATHIPRMIRDEGIEFVVVNAENVAGGSGITPKIAEELFDLGVDCLTSGDHFFRRREVEESKDFATRILRPINYPPQAPGIGAAVITSRSGTPVGVINVAGRVFMRYHFDCPFRTVRACLDELRKRVKVILVDVHAEATSEKIALGWYLDGEVSAVVGSHTHIQTADEKILPKGTAYLTDLGMTGPYDSVIGREKAQIIEQFLTQVPVRSDVASGDAQLHGAIIDVDPTTGKAKTITRVQRKV